MNTAEYVSGIIYPAALSFLPARMASPEAKAMTLAIGFQESAFTHRKQIGGPARGFWQFEDGGGVDGVLGHPATKPIITPILSILVVKEWDCYEAIGDNDILACIFARLLLWAHPGPLPRRDSPLGAWKYYLDQWRPGKPHRETWDFNYARAWEMVGQ